MKATFNQLCAGCLAGLSLIAIVCVYFFPAHGNPNAQTQALTALTGCLSACVIYLMKANSDAQNQAKESQYIDALKNSAPVNNSQQSLT